MLRSTTLPGTSSDAFCGIERQYSLTNGSIRGTELIRGFAGGAPSPAWRCLSALSGQQFNGEQLGTAPGAVAGKRAAKLSPKVLK